MNRSTIFVAADDEDLPMVLQILRTEGHRVVGVSDAETAIYILEGLKPDLIVTEYPTMMTGAARLIDELCNKPGTACKKLALLPRGGGGTASAALASGFDAVYERPIVQKTFVAVVDQLLRAA